MEKEFEILKEVKKKTLERIIEEFGTGIGELSKMKLSILDARTIIYEEVDKIAKIVFDFEYGVLKKDFEEDFQTIKYAKSEESA